MSILECFSLDDITNIGAKPVYDRDKDQPVVFATSTGVAHMNPSGFGTFEVPLFLFNEKGAENLAAQLLVCAALCHRKKTHFGIHDARRTLGNRDLFFSRLLTFKDHKAIPQDMSIAVAEPEFLGKYVIEGSLRGLAILNIKAVVGYMIGSKNESGNRKNRRTTSKARVQHHG